MTNSKEVVIIATLNSPYKSYMDAKSVVDAIKNCEPNCSQIYSFFTDLSIEDQLDFAKSKGISEKQLIQTAKKMSKISGQKMPICVEHEF